MSVESAKDEIEKAKSSEPLILDLKGLDLTDKDMKKNHALPSIKFVSSD